MKKVLFLLAIFIIVIGNLYAQQTESLDGNGWKLLNRYRDGMTMRMVLVQGIIAGAEAMNRERAREIYPGSDYNKLSLMMDEFYSEDKNLSIPTQYALYVIFLKIKNHPKNEIDEAIKKFRKGFQPQFLEIDKEKAKK